MESKRTQEIDTLVLPSDNDEMEHYVNANKKEVYDRIITNIGYALKQGWGAVEVFSFVDTNFVVVINQKDFRDGLMTALEYSKKAENYELCDKAKKVIDLLDRLSFVVNYKIKPKKLDVKEEKPTPRNTGKRKRKK